MNSLTYRILDPVKVATTPDSTPRIAKQAYELYERQGRRGDHVVENWLQAEKTIRKAESHK